MKSPMRNSGSTSCQNVNGLAEPLTGQRVRDLEPLVDWVAPMLYHSQHFASAAKLWIRNSASPTSFRRPETRLLPVRSRPIVIEI